MNKVVLLLLVSTVGLGLVSLHLVRELRAERTHSSALQTELDGFTGVSTAFQAEHDSRAEPAAVTAAASAPSSERASTPKAGPALTVSGVQVPMVAYSSPSSSPEEQMKQMRERQRALMQDPAYREATIEQQKNNVRMMQRGLQRELGMSDEQYDRLLELQAEQQLRAFDLMEPYAYGDGPMDAAVAQEQTRKIGELQERNQKELRAQLGEDKYRAYQDYQMTTSARAEVTQLNLTLAEAGMPLREDQIKPLIRAIHESNLQLSQDSMKTQQGFMSQLNARTATPNDFQQQQVDLMREHNKRIRQAAARVLSEEQVEMLTQQQEERFEMQEAQLKMMQAQDDAIARGEVPPVSPALGVAVSGTQVYFEPAPR